MVIIFPKIEYVTERNIYTDLDFECLILLVVFLDIPIMYRVIFKLDYITNV